MSTVFTVIYDDKRIPLTSLASAQELAISLIEDGFAPEVKVSWRENCLNFLEVWANVDGSPELVLNGEEGKVLDQLCPQGDASP